MDCTKTKETLHQILFKIVQSIHHICYIARKTCQTRFRVLKPKGVGAPPTSPKYTDNIPNKDI